jgi:acyl-CoA thioester hydrolase
VIVGAKHAASTEGGARATAPDARAKRGRRSRRTVRDGSRGPSYAAGVPFTHVVQVRYLEADLQGVVFNMWYLAYFDDALAAFLEHGGLPYDELMAAGYDVQLVHTELDWRGPLRPGERAEVDVALARLGTTSFTLQFGVRVGERPVASGETVYVAVETGGWTKVTVPDLLKDALGPVSPLR